MNQYNEKKNYHLQLLKKHIEPIILVYHIEAKKRKDKKQFH